ncbi:hypothetical protein AXF42_Ash016378 [Apostasia shenzhenica]|uniref:Kri1-like C-terminal domain-containing protein n=1 Tax=Apostasia shenzhenica TaxID=1088818 RepID=A0A2I0A006_9ASPA|nr:hypothetical protein AXF42_Ash016378 [Apostasia shenzhenica]
MGIDILGVCDPDAADADLSKIEINQEYAKRLEHNKKREALHKLEELKKRGLAEESDGSDESSDDSTDGDGDDLVDSNKEIQFYDTLVRVKKKDPIILQKDAKLLSLAEDEENKEAVKNKAKTGKKEKPLYLKDVMAKLLIEEGPEFEDEPLKANPKLYDKEQAEGLKAFLQAEKEAFASDDDGDLIKKKEIRRIDAVAHGNDDEIHKRLDEFFGEDGDLTEDNMFLKNYLRNRMWVDHEEDRRPFDDIRFSEDEDELEKQDKYEAQYNFRHEEGQEDRVLGHSRITEGTVRKKTSSRMTQRKSKEERMARAEFERKEELKHLKNLKKKEIQKKLERIRSIAGIGKEGACNLDAADLEEDFDPDEYDKRMKEMFGVDYYDAEDADPDFGSDDGDEIEKLDFDKEDELLGLRKDWDGVNKGEGFEAVRKRLLEKNEEEEPTKEEGRRKRKRKISLREKVELDKELEEYYKLDYEGTIGDLKTRFKYRSVPANRFGLHAEEILVANDKDLNQYVSLRRLAPYREKEWTVTYHQKLKKKMILQGGKRDGKIADKKHRKEGVSGDSNKHKKTECKDVDEDANAISKRSRKRRKHAQLKLSKSRLMAYGKIPFKPQKKR